MDVRVLGHVAVVVDERPAPLGGRRQRAVLAGLVVHGAEGVSTDALVDLVWGAAPPPSARKSLQTYVARLRRLLGPDAIVSRPDGYAWALPPEQLDATRFWAMVDQARADPDPERRWERLGAALDLWRGEPFSDVALDGAVAAHGQRLREARLDAAVLRAAAGAELGRHREVVADLQALLEAHPLREALWEQLLLALEGAGRHTEAIEAFGRCRAVLADELGVDPSPRLSALAERLLRRDPGADAPPPPAPAAPRVRNPYKGLRAFGEDDRDDFHGREALVGALAQRLDEERFLALVGPSGSGKSSLALAGLVPALRRRATGRVLVVTMSPGTHPFAHLEAALAAATGGDGPPLRRRGDDLDLLRAVLALTPADGDELLLVVDQLEELLTGAVARTESTAFVRNLAEAVEDPHGHLRVVVTLRADFVDAALRHPELASLLAEATVHVPPLTAVELQAAVVRPARAVGLDVDPALVTELVAQTVQHPGSLPLLQFVLTQLVDEAEGTILTLGALERAGGVQGVLARRAEQVHDRLPPSAQAATRLLFLRLVAVTDVGEATRRVVAVDDLDLPAGVAPAAEQAMDAFVAGRLLVRDRDAATARATVQVAHEAVLREWPRCVDWIATAVADLRAGMDLERAAADWVAAGRSPDFLLTGERLRAHEVTFERSEVGASTTARDLLAASADHRRRTEEGEAARVAHERDLERRAVQRLRAVVAVLLVLGLVTTSLSLYALERRTEAERGRRQFELATTETLVRRLSFAASAQGEDPQLSLLLALHAVRTATSAGVPVPTETVEALHLALQAAGVPYPVGTDAPVMVLSGLAGPTGAFQLPLADLVALARSAVTRQLTESECRVFLATGACPRLPDDLAAGLDDGADAGRAVASGALDGTTVTITGPADGLEVDAYRAEFEAFVDATGIDVRFTSEGVLDADGLRDEVTRRVDVVIVPQPTYVVEQARGGALVDLSGYLSSEQVASDVGDHLVSLVTVDERLVALPLHAAIKSLVWYSPRWFEAAGYAPPTSWEQLLALSDRIVADGGTPWCMGEESGEATGWPATDWVEDLLLHVHGPEVYDAWVTGEIGFTDPRVVDAFERFGALAFTDGYVRGGGRGAVETNVMSAHRQLLTDPPGCWMLHQPHFMAGWLPAEVVPGVDIDVFPMPTDDPALEAAMVVQASFAMVLSDRPEVRALVRRLADPDFGDVLADQLPIVMLNRRFPAGRYASPWKQQLGRWASAAVEADLVRNDGSDTMDPAIGTTAIWSAMADYLVAGPAALDEILEELDAVEPSRDAASS